MLIGGSGDEPAPAGWEVDGWEREREREEAWGSLSQEGRGALRRGRGSRAPSFFSFHEACRAGFGRVRCCPGSRPQRSLPPWLLACAGRAQTGQRRAVRPIFTHRPS